MFTEQLTQGLSVIDVINFSAANNTNLNSIGVDMSLFKRVIFVIGNGGLGAAGTIDGRLQSAALSNFATVHNITGSNLAQINTTGTISGNNLTSTIEVRSDQVQQQNSGDRYVRLQLTTGGNALTGVWAVGLGGEAAQKPASNDNLNTKYLQQSVVVA